LEVVGGSMDFFEVPAPLNRKVLKSGCPILFLAYSKLYLSGEKAITAKLIYYELMFESQMTF
jgi:hypothetical protein